MSSGDINARGSRRIVVNLWFNESVWGFNNEFPTELSSILGRSEWNSIINHLNNDLNSKLKQHWHRTHKLIQITAVTSFLGVGILLWPAVIAEIELQKRLLRKYWKSVRKYLHHLSQQDTARHRFLLWKLVVNEERLAQNSIYLVPNYYRAICIEWSR